MTTRIDYVKGGVKIVCDTSIIPAPKPKSAWPIPVFSGTDHSFLSITPVAMDQYSRSGLQIDSVSYLPGSLNASWTLFWTAYQGTPPSTLAWNQVTVKPPADGLTAYTVSIFLNQVLPDATFLAYLRRVEAGKTYTYATITATTPSDSTWTEIQNILSDGILSKGTEKLKMQADWARVLNDYQQTVEQATLVFNNNSGNGGGWDTITGFPSQDIIGAGEGQHLRNAMMMLWDVRSYWADASVDSDVSNIPSLYNGAHAYPGGPYYPYGSDPNVGPTLLERWSNWFNALIDLQININYRIHPPPMDWALNTFFYPINYLDVYGGAVRKSLNEPGPIKGIKGTGVTSSNVDNYTAWEFIANFGASGFDITGISQTTTDPSGPAYYPGAKVINTANGKLWTRDSGTGWTYVMLDTVASVSVGQHFLYTEYWDGEVPMGGHAYAVPGTNVYLREVAASLIDPTKFRVINVQGFENYGAEFRLGDSYPATGGGIYNIVYDTASYGEGGAPKRIIALLIGATATAKQLGMIKQGTNVSIATDGTLSVSPGTGLGSVTNVSADVTTPLSIINPTTTPIITMTQASRTTGGWLSAYDYGRLMDLLSTGTTAIDGGSATSTDSRTIDGGTATSTDTITHDGGTA